MVRLSEMIYTEEEYKTLKDKIEFLTKCLDDRDKSIELLKEERDNFMLKYSKAVEEKIVETNELCTERNKLEQENKKLKDKLDAFESSKFNTMALLEIQHPKTAREAENLLQVKKVFERLYNDRLYCLEEENKSLKSDLEKFSEAYKKYRDYEKEELAESCYDLARENDKLKEEVARLEFDIEAWKKLKVVREDKERILNEEIRRLRDEKYSHGEPVTSSGPCFIKGNVS